MSAEVILKKGEGRSLKAGGAWIYDNEIDRVAGSYENGDMVQVSDFDGYPLGTGFINDRSTITVRMLSRGQLKINMEMLGSDEPMGKLSRIVNRMTLGMIAAGSFVSAALISGSAGPEIFGLPVLSFIGYAAGTALTIWVLVDIIRRGNNP